MKRNNFSRSGRFSRGKHLYIGPKTIISALVAIGLMLAGFVVYTRYFRSASLTRVQFDLSAIKTAKNIVPVLVVGSGPAGLAAAMYTARGGMHTVVVEGSQPGGQLMGTSWVENWPGMKKMLGPDLMKNAREQAQEFGTLFLSDRVVEIGTNTWPYTVSLASGKELSALTIIVATGSEPKRLGIPGEQEYWAKGVSACATCDAPFFKGADIAVIGGGDSALEEAMQLSAYAQHIYLIVRGPKMRASQTMQERIKAYPQIEVLLQTKPEEVVGNGVQVTGLRVDNNGEKRLLGIQGLFLAIGHTPNSAFLPKVIQRDADGVLVLEGNSQKTTVLGIYGAGDVADARYRQAGVAAGAGVRAGLDALDFLAMQGVQKSIFSNIEGSLFIPDGGQQRKALPELTSVKEFDQLLQQKRIVCIDFFSEMCPACVQLLPVLELAAFAREHVAMAKINIFALNELRTRFNITKVPTVALFVDGRLVERLQGFASYQKILELLDNHR